MGLVDQGNTFNGIFTPLHKTVYPFKILSYITPSRQMLTSFTYLQYSESRDYDGAFECTATTTAPRCLAGLTYYCKEEPCVGRTGHEILKSLELQGYDSEDSVGERILVLIYYILLFKLISVLRMYMKAVVIVPNAPQTSKTKQQV